jgi:putative nucleotidyltransferase with HDIG domain
MISIAKRLDGVEDLPALPHTFQKVLEQLDNVAADAKSLESVIEDDPVLAAKILKVANSPLFGVSGQVTKVSHAIVVLGFDEVKNLVIGLALTQSFPGDLSAIGVSAKDLWMHSIAVGKTAKAIAEESSGVDPEEIFIAGLMHDLGRFLICLYFEDHLPGIKKIEEEKQVPMFKAEELYGLSHAEAGAYLAKKWELSNWLVNVIRYHHQPASAGNEAPAASMIFLADQLCQKLGIGWKSQYLPEKVMVPKSLNVDAGLVKKVAKQMAAEKGKLEASWSTALG